MRDIDEIDWQDFKRLQFEDSFEAVVLFSMLGLVLTMLFA